MGVVGLWNIVTPLSKTIPVYELRGKTVAVDLSCWIVDSQNAGPDDGSNKHLRAIYFRTMALLLNGINPVFVLEGTAPVLKHDIIRERNQNRKHNKNEDKKGKKGQSQRANGGRGHVFNNVVNECKTLLKLIGLTCIRAHGEAEAMCAYLNQDGMVDGCITQDSDCFLYGAKVVYRNLAFSQKSGLGCSVEEHSMDRIEKIYNLGRNKMIGMALLCGCDYGPGVPGVGKEGAIKLLRAADEKDILTRLKSWKTDGSIYKLETAVAASKNMSDEMKKLISNELSIRKKCVAIDNFPMQELIDEFKIRRGQVPTKIDKWDCPNISELIKFMEKKLKWKPVYALLKTCPLLIRWYVDNLYHFPSRVTMTMRNQICPKEIKRVRNQQSINYVEIEWVLSEEFGNLIELEEEEHENNQRKMIITTYELQDQIKKLFPDLYEAYETKISQKKKPRKTCAPQSNGDNLIQPSKNFKQRKCKLHDEKDRKIYEFFPQKKRINCQKDLNLSVNSKNALTQINGVVEGLFNELAEEDFATDVEEDSMEMSLIVGKVCQCVDKNKKTDTVPMTAPVVEDKIQVDNCDVNVSLNKSCDSSDFDIPYIPLGERIKK
ncbi:flap endonuclease GEN [Chelonus insularis]|uniref:flap endonuclease GEN n=1 Tax=Chelonus insularis TaxID=460826 RepID=UPI00158AC6D6|nr:flap endonuclease GEN [Chelonus insularis]